jgi:hypothetical protein
VASGGVPFRMADIMHLLAMSSSAPRRRRLSVSARGSAPRWRQQISFLLLALQLVYSTGCTAWAQTPVTTLAEPLPNKVKMWVGDSAYILHDPVVRNDSLLGWERSGDVKGSSLAWPTSRVDSLQTRQITTGGTILLGVGVALGLLILIGGLAQAGTAD